MVIHIRDGKRGRDRYVMLSPVLLQALRSYWRLYRPDGLALFPGDKPGTCIQPEAVRDALRQALKKAGINKRVTPHTLRCATFLRPTCSKRARTSASSRSCSVTARSAARPATRT
jgi:integrase